MPTLYQNIRIYGYLYLLTGSAMLSLVVGIVSRPDLPMTPFTPFVPFLLALGVICLFSARYWVIKQQYARDMRLRPKYLRCHQELAVVMPTAFILASVYWLMI